MENDKLLKIYEIYINEGLTLFSGYEKRLSFYAGLISAIIGGIVACFISIGLSPTFLFAFLFCLIFLVFISKLSIWSLDRLYQQLLENITVRAKFEYDLSLLSKRKVSKSENNNWNGWKPEPYIMKRHIESRSGYSSSEKFVECESKKGYQQKIVFFIRSIYIFIIILFVFYLVYYLNSY